MKMKYLIITISTIFLANCATTSSEIPESPIKEFKIEEKTLESIDPFGGVQFFMDGMMFFEQGNYARAILEFQDAIDAGSNSAEVLFNMSEAYWMLQKYEKSILFANQAIAMDENALDLSLIHI